MSSRRAFLIALLLVAPSFATAQDYAIAFTPTERGIYSMNARGSGLKRLTDDTMVILTDRAWSPDGKQIVFSAFRQDDAALGQKYNLPFHFPLYLMAADGSSQKRLLDVPALPDETWSPDGKSLLFTSGYESAGREALTAIYVLHVATGKLDRLTDLGSFAAPSWSPDGTRIAYASGGPRSREIYVMKADGSDAKPLTNLGMMAGQPAWSPDGHTIAFVANGWFLMDADGSNKRRVSRLAASKVAWSPDGKHLLVSAQGGAYVCDADGTNSKPMPSTHGRVIDGVFSPDGQRVIYRSHEGSAAKIYSANADGSDWRTLNDHVGEHVLFAVSPVLH